jgi:hypothetical protein
MILKGAISTGSSNLTTDGGGLAFRPIGVGAGLATQQRRVPLVAAAFNFREKACGGSGRHDANE